MSTVEVSESEPSGQKYPAGQLVPVVIDPARQYLPTGQTAHSLAAFKFVLSLYVPLGQGVLVMLNTPLT